jgi:hypothetical protein
MDRLAWTARFFIVIPSGVRHHLDGQRKAATPSSPRRRSRRTGRIQAPLLAQEAAIPSVTGSRSGTSDGALGGLARWRHQPSESRPPRRVHSGEVAPMSRGGRLQAPLQGRTLTRRGSCHGRRSGESRRPRLP